MSFFRVPLLLVAVGCSEYDIHPGVDTNGLGEDDTNGGDTGEGLSDELGGITGRICSPSENSWVSGADVWVELENGDVTSTTTDADGYFTLTGIPVGDQTVYVTKGSFSTEFDVEVFANQVTELAEVECLQDEDVNIAVITGAYDYIEGVLDDLGFDYTLYDSYELDYNTYEYRVTEFLRDPDELEQYDVIFFNCGMNTDWEYYYEAEVANNLADYVENGGSIYASDWAYWITEVSHPNMLRFYGTDSYDGEAHVGDEGLYDATVLDADMVNILGTNSAEINYDLGIWVVPTSVGDGTALIKGNVYAYGSPVNNAVLAARQYVGDGQMLYTSFHNEQQTTWHMDLLLEEIIFSL